MLGHQVFFNFDFPVVRVGVVKDRPMTNGVLHKRPVMWSFAVSLSPAWTNCRTNRRVADDFRRHDVHNHVNRVYLTISWNGMSICRYCWAEARHGSTSSQGRSVFQRNCNKWTRKTVYTFCIVSCTHRKCNKKLTWYVRKLCENTYKNGITVENL